jgi:TetR/AcrR family transcriptional repressor of uid operon
MRRANAQLQSDRRAEILAAAQRCFVRSGFHRASMHDICAEAGMSPGNLYRYFPSKESLIAGIAERDRAEVGQRFARADLDKGLFTVIEDMARHYFARWPMERVLLCTEVMAEARRNSELARISSSFDADVRNWLAQMLRAGAECGDISDDVDLDGVITMLMIITDGLWWRRALDPEFNPETMVAIFTDIARHMLRAHPGISPEQRQSHSESTAGNDNRASKESLR